MPDIGCNNKYDELLILARDARIRRRKTSLWTSTFVLAGIIGTATIVSTANQSAADLAAEKDRSDRALLALEREREALRAERDLYIAASGWLAGLTKTEVPPQPQPGTVETKTELLRDVIWLVDGSRQVPMATGDFLWIPETDAWVEIDDIDAGDVTIHWNRDRSVSSSAILPIQLEVNNLNAANYACIRVFEGNSRRSSFGGDFRDIDIRFQSEECGPNYTRFDRSQSPPEAIRLQPVATGDFLEIPEANGWAEVEIDDIEAGNVRIHWNRDRTLSSSATLPIQLDVNKEIANYACIRVFEETPNRPSFRIHTRFQGGECKSYVVTEKLPDESGDEIQTEVEVVYAKKIRPIPPIAIELNESP